MVIYEVCSEVKLKYMPQFYMECDSSGRLDLRAFVAQPTFSVVLSVTRTKLEKCCSVVVSYILVLAAN